jgi:hypothetical protein
MKKLGMPVSDEDSASGSGGVSTEGGGACGPDALVPPAADGVGLGLVVVLVEGATLGRCGRCLATVGGAGAGGVWLPLAGAVGLVAVEVVGAAGAALVVVGVLVAVVVGGAASHAVPAGASPAALAAGAASASMPEPSTASTKGLGCRPVARISYPAGS